MKVIACAALCCWSALAAAAPSPKDLTWTLTNRGDDADDSVKFGFDSHGAHDAPKTWRDADLDQMDLVELVAPTTIAQSTDGTAAWAGTIARLGEVCRGLASTIAQCGEAARVAVVVVYDKAGKKWNPVVVHSAAPVADKDLPKLAARGGIEKFAKKIDASAAEVADLFVKTIADPKALAASVSARKDVVLFGSGPGEHAEGGAKVAATLARWKLALHVDQDSIQAGTTTSKTVAWVAANVAGRPVGKSDDTPPLSYRVLAVYEKGKAWQLVAIQFSYPNADSKQQARGY